EMNTELGKPASNIDCSIIIPVYCNEQNVWPTFKKIHEAVVLHNPEMVFEVIFVDDGSYDNSMEKLIELKEAYKDIIKVIKLTRNFGQVNALYAGYAHSRGKCIVNISADLQDPPELINDMLKYHFEENYPIVVCTRSEREESYFRRKTSSFFYKAMRKLSFSNMPPGGFDFLLVGSKIKKLILDNMEANAFWQGQILWTGYRAKFIPYKRMAREIGESKWTFSKKLKYLIDGVLGYSFFPIRIMSILGLIISLSGFVYAIVIVIAKFAGSYPFQGWAPLMVIVLFLSGFQMLMLGIIGEYLWRTLDEVRRRQLYIIDEIYE
ncbi:MAG: glycosyltransferase family 2 protein, partial [Ignavibacteria bacterium]|nr:glycosyltransferase family 2 protein [Ignavibacteria bacterium]